MPKAHIVLIKSTIDMSPSLVDTLRSNGYRAEIVPAGSDIVKTADGRNPDIVIAGDSAESSSALEAALSLRDRCQAPIIWLSAKIDDADRARAALVPHLTIISPPCTNSDLMYAIETALLSRRREQELIKKADLYRLIVESANSIILRMDTSGTVLYLNDFGLKFFGFTKDDLSGRNVIGTIVPPVDSAGKNLATMITDIGKNPDRYVNNENENMRSDGSTVYVAWTNRAIHDENGALSAILCVGNDITARKQAGEALERSLEEKSTLLRELQHRVKNNLTILSMLLSVEARDLGEGNARRIINDVQNRIKTMATLYESLYSAGNLTHLELNGYIEHLARTLFKTFTMERQNIRLVTRLDAMRIDLKRAVPAGLILNELLTNAAKYAFQGRGSGTITVNLRGENDMAVLSISDDGIGLPDGFALDRSAGTGLKLVGTLSRQLGGDFTIESGAGTTARIGFPLPQQEPGAAVRAPDGHG